MPHGRFIVVEGLEGAGKSSAIHTIIRYLSGKLTVPIVSTREPGGTRVGEVVRTLIKERDSEPLHDYTEMLLLYAARVQLVEQVIRPALAQGQWVVADRFELSTFAYQGGGRNIAETALSNLSQLALDGFQPDLTLFLDIDPKQGLERAKRRGKADRIEAETQVFFQRVYEAYHQRLKKMTNVVLIDASQPLDVVQQTIIHHLEHFVTSHAHC